MTTLSEFTYFLLVVILFAGAVSSVCDVFRIKTASATITGCLSTLFLLFIALLFRVPLTYSILEFIDFMRELPYGF